MFRIHSQSDLIECFRDSEREDIVLPENIRFPIVIKDYLSWIEPSGAKAFLVFSDLGGKKPLGVVFRRGSGSTVALCDWCHSMSGGEGVGLLTARATPSRRVGVHVCSDLSCADKIRGNLAFQGTERLRIRAVIERMSKSARQNLF